MCRTARPLCVKRLRAELARSQHKQLTRLFRRHTFVGVVDDRRSLVQHETKLYIVDHVTVARRLFYQQALRRFGAMPRIVMDEPMPVGEMVTLALDLREAGWRPEDGPKADLAANVEQLLREKGPMLEEYFRISFDDEHAGRLEQPPRQFDLLP